MFTKGQSKILDHDEVLDSSGNCCFFHSAGGLLIGKNVGIGPGVKIITSVHAEEGVNKPILHSRLEFAPVTIGNDCDIGAGVIVLPGIMYPENWTGD
jgi:acetyltransferase-like isoleucine patch superfamily enzyme